MSFYLYIKTHSVTGLKYLGQTKSKDPHKYTGSGKHWLAHLRKHGKNYTTEILIECLTTEELSTWGKYYSELWNVAESKEWANLKPEMGEGGWYLTGDLNPQKRPEVRQKTSIGMKRFLENNPKTVEQKKRHSNWNKLYWTDEKKQNHPVAHSIDTVSVTDVNGKSARISKTLYDSIDRTVPIEEQLYVSVSSKESKRRRNHLRTVT